MLLVLPLLLAASPADVAALRYAEGVEALRDHRAEEAARALQACVDLAPDEVACHWELGWAWWVLGDPRRTVEAWETVARLAPDHPELDTWLPRARERLAARERQEALRAAAPATVRPAREDARLRIRAVGDVMLGTDTPPGHLPPDGGARMLADVATLLADADLTFANLEGPLCDGGTTTKCREGGNCYAFRTPTSYGRWLAEAGIDLVSTANNHSGDFGETCRRETEATLDALGIAWSGPPGTVATVEAGGLRVALAAFHTSPSCNHLNDLEGAARLVEAAAATHDIVIVSFHGGAEGADARHVPRGRETFHGEDRGDLRAFARAVVDAGADLVIGHGPHVLRGMEVLDGRLVAYSLGNFATWGRFNLAGPLGTGMILEVELDGAGRFLGGRIVPTRQVERGRPVPDPEGRAIDQVRELTAADFPETGPRIARDGTLAPVSGTP